MKLRLIHVIAAVFAIILGNACSKSDGYNSSDLHNGDNTGGGGDTGNNNHDTIYRNVVYGANTNWLGQYQQLALDVYLPPQSLSNKGIKSPLILYIHGGGFVGGDKESAASFSNLMSKKGFVVVPINYRLGWSQGDILKCEGDTSEAIEAYYRAVQDTRAALRFLVANADIYSIDTNWIFVAGSSAGGVTTLGVAYLTQQTADYYMKGVSAKLGPLDVDNVLPNTYTIKGLISMWGALYSANLITESNAKPTIFFQGMNDNVVPFDVDNFYMCDNFPIGYGTKPLYNTLVSFGVPAVAHVDPNGGHGVYTTQSNVDNSACFLNSLIDHQPQTGYYLGNISNCK